MNRVLKSLLLWLLILALPVQGLAAAIKFSCAAGRHADPAPMTAMQHDVRHDNMHHAHGMPEHQDHSRHHAAHHAASHADNIADVTDTADTAGAVDNDDASTGATVHKSSFCSACHACCIGAMMPSSMVQWTPLRHEVKAIVVDPVPLFTGFIPPGLERPPRLFS